MGSEMCIRDSVSGVVFIALLASSRFGLSPLLADWGWIDSKTLFLGSAASAMKDATFWNFFLPVLTISLYGMGYIAGTARGERDEPQITAPPVKAALGWELL